MFSKKLILAFSSCVFACCLFSTAAAQSQPKGTAGSVQTEPDKILEQLLKEVRELRVAVQRATLINTRFQMLIERVKLQQGQVDAASRRLDNHNTEVADVRSAKHQMEQQVKEAEELLERTTDPNGRSDMESRIKSMKANLARFGLAEEGMRNRAPTLETELQAAQAKLNELNSQLDTLMNEIAQY